MTEVIISNSHVDGRYRNGGLFGVVVPTSQDSMLQSLHQHNVEIIVKEAPEDWQSWMLNIAPLILLAILWLVMVRQMKRRTLPPNRDGA